MRTGTVLGLLVFVLVCLSSRLSVCLWLSLSLFLVCLSRLAVHLRGGGGRAPGGSPAATQPCRRVWASLFGTMKIWAEQARPPQVHSCCCGVQDAGGAWASVGCARVGLT